MDTNSWLDIEGIWCRYCSYRESEYAFYNFIQKEFLDF